MVIHFKDGSERYCDTLWFENGLLNADDMWIYGPNEIDYLEDGEPEFSKPLPYGKNTTICGEDGCDGCLLQHSRDIEACRTEAKRKGFDIESYR